MKNVLHNLSKEQLFEILEHVYNEVYVLDGNMNIIYVNPACYTNYGLTPEEMVGKNHNEFTGDVWYPSVVPEVFKQKRQMCVEQVVYTGKRVVSTATPVLDENNEIELVVCVTEERFEHLDIQYNPEENGVEVEAAKEVEPENFGEIIAISQEMINLYKAAKRAAAQKMPVLLHGETGTGKTVLAKFIHESSTVAAGEYVAVNCAAIPSALLEAEMFGHKAHAFTGANPKGAPGLVSMAHHGTLFLDEIGELSLPLQAKLLEVLESKSFIPIGGSEVEHVDFRLIAATNRDLQEMVRQKQFREDLYWRINAIDIKIPPLRNRTDDIVGIAKSFLQTLNAKYQSNKGFSEDVLSLFTLYQWPGNVRQLRNTIERAVVVSSEDTLRVEDLPPQIIQELQGLSNGGYDYEECKENWIRQIIQEAYEEHKTTRKIAQALGISQATVSRLVKKHTTRAPPSMVGE